MQRANVDALHDLKGGSGKTGLDVEEPPAVASADDEAKAYWKNMMQNVVLPDMMKVMHRCCATLDPHLLNPSRMNAPVVSR